MRVLLDKLKEVLYTVLPIAIIVIILHFTITPLETHMILKFLVGTVIIIIGLSIFLFGVDIGITPIGNNIGSSLIKTNKILMLTAVGLVLGFIISAAEPDLHILARQVRSCYLRPCIKNSYSSSRISRVGFHNCPGTCKDSL